MIAIERKQKIIEYVEAHQLVSVSQLAEIFNVHEATIRRDLANLEQEGFLRRTHGGVVAAQKVQSEPEFSRRSMENTAEKKVIGHLAASLINEGDNIIVDSGTTTFQLIEHVVLFENLTIITNDINIAAELRMYPNIKTFVTGGMLTPESYMLNGFHTNEILRSFQVDKAFIGTPAFHFDKGITHFDEHLVSAKKEMIASADEIIVMTDHTKIGKVSLHSIASIDKINWLVTDEKIEQTEMKRIQQRGVRVLSPLTDSN